MHFLVSTSVAFVLISLALAEFCGEFKCFFDVINSAANSTNFTVALSQMETLHVHLRSYGLTMAAACACPLSPRGP